MVATSDLGALVASPHFRWVRGMIDTDGAVCVDVDHGKPTIWWCEGCGGEVPEEDLPCDEPTLLDLDNPGNHGHLLALVRKAWGGRVKIYVYDDGAASVHVRGGGDYNFKHDTLGLALAAALLAAPSPPVNGWQSLGRLAAEVHAEWGACNRCEKLRKRVGDEHRCEVCGDTLAPPPKAGES